MGVVEVGEGIDEGLLLVSLFHKRDKFNKYLICQDKAQLDAAYGKDESVTSNCHVTVAYAPNKVETAKYLSDRLGVTTVIKEQESVSFQGGVGIFAKKSVTKSQQEVQRAVLTPDEIMRLPGPVKDADQMITKPDNKKDYIT